MTRHLTLLTGASRGMGLAMAEQLLDAGHDLVCLSRHTNEPLAARAQAAGRRLEQWTVDLAEPLPIAARLEDWLAQQDATAFASVTLVNNAAIVTRVAPLGDIDAAELARSMRVNLEAPIVLSGAFLRATAGWRGVRKLLNISSGLGRRAMASTGPYCAAKAGMDHYTRCVALEEAHRPNGAKACSLAPGVIDTDMQVHLRSSDPAAFPDRGNFVGLKEKGQLTSPADAARRVLDYLARADFGSNPVGDVRD